MSIAIYNPKGTLVAKFLAPQHAGIFLAAIQRGTVETWTVKVLGRIVYKTDHTRQSSFEPTAIAVQIATKTRENQRERIAAYERKTGERAAHIPAALW